MRPFLILFGIFGLEWTLVSYLRASKKITSTTDSLKNQPKGQGKALNWYWLSAGMSVLLLVLILIFPDLIWWCVGLVAIKSVFMATFEFVYSGRNSTCDD